MSRRCWAEMSWIWDEKAECMDPEERKALQLERLREIVKYAYERVEWYRRKFDEAGIRPEDIRTLDDIRLIPFTTKEELREVYPFGLLAVPLSEIVEIHTSSGTTGKPVVVGYTRRDLDLWGEVMARAYAAAGARPGDVAQIAYGYGLFTGGLGFHYGAQKMGLTVVPTSAGNTKRQVMLMADFGTNVLACTPSYSLYIAEVAREMGMDARSLPLKAGLFGAEPWSEGMRQEIERSLGLSAFDHYGLTEIIGPGVSFECPAKEGLHINEDHFYPEVIDPETGEPLPEGEEGELVLTTLTKEGMPVLRFRTRDITRIWRERCRCGRTLVKMARVKGRTDDMLIVRGVNVFPSQIEQVLMSVDGVAPHYQIIVDRVGRMDELEIKVEVTEKVLSDEVRRMEEVRERLESEVESVLGIRAKVTLVEPGSIERSMGKAKRVIDKRRL